ncbi:MAG: hypothetical protein DRQ55_09020 [Planctomycetota bacterium]|nr:MAG: hypothetical protein DRQ55_09020 [Planctomycetota bacterium]
MSPDASRASRAGGGDQAIPPKRLPSGPKGQHPLTLLVVPTKEERGNLDWVMERFQDLDDADLHILIVDDDSIDKTWSRAGDWAADDERMHLMRRPGRFKGSGFALREAYAWAAKHEFGYQYLIQAAANGGDDIGQLPKFIAALEAGADVVIGERSEALDGDDSGPRLAQGLARSCTGSPVGDVESGFRGWRMDALRAIANRLKATDHRLKAESLAAAAKAGLSIVGVPVPRRERLATTAVARGGDSGVGALLSLKLRRMLGRL